MDEQRDPQQEEEEYEVGAEATGEFAGAPTTPIDEQARARQVEGERVAPEQPAAPQYPPYPQNPPRPYPEHAPYSGPAYPTGAPGYAAGPRERRGTSGWVKASVGCLIALVAVMACCALGTGLAAGLRIVSTDVTGSQTQSFAVNGTPHVVLTATAGNVIVGTGDADTVHVSLSKSVRAISQGLAQQALDGVRFNATQDGNTITITSTYGTFGSNPLVYSRSLEMTITVPPTTDLDTTLTAGNLNVSGTTGALQVRSSAGNVTLDSVTLRSTSSLHLTAGNVTLHGALTPHTALEADVTAGNVSLFLPADTAAHLAATVTAGHVSTAGWASSQDSTSGTLSQDLNPNPTSTITIQVTAGNASVVAS